jgi:hypothetical protein
MVFTKLGDAATGKYSILDDSHVKLEIPKEDSMGATFVIHDDTMVFTMDDTTLSFIRCK